MSKEKQKHTEEPWKYEVVDSNDSSFVYARIGIDSRMSIAFAGCYGGTEYSKEEAKANAHRIVACVNALAGLNPEAVPEAVEALKTCSRILSQCNRPTEYELNQMTTEVNAALAGLKKVGE